VYAGWARTGLDSLVLFWSPLRIGRTGDRVAVVTETDGFIKRTGYIWDHCALTHLYALDEKQAMAKTVFCQRFLKNDFSERCHSAILEPTSSLEPVLQPANSRSLLLGTERACAIIISEREDFLT
jgi:hypothetical protein